MSKLIPNPGAKTTAGAAANIKALGERLSNAVAAAVYQEANVVMEKSVKVTPKDTGNLRNSHYVELPKRTRGGVTVEIGFQGKRAPYAAAVHEMGVSPRKTIAWSEPGTGAKFLENPVKEASPQFADRVADRVKRMLGANNAPRPG